MMEFSGLFSSSDNLFKFLTVSGIIMIILSLVYPLQKKQLIDIELNTHNQQVELINKEIQQINEEITHFKNNESPRLLSLVDSLKTHINKDNHNDYSKIIEENKNKFNSKYEFFEKKEQELEIKSTVLKYGQEKIEILKSHSKEYKDYSWWFTRLGIFSSFFGLIFWVKSTAKKEKLVSKELAEK